VRVSKAAISAHDIATRFWRDRTGAVAVALAVLLPVLIGFAGIGIEVGLWFEVQRQNQSATDAAAISAALEYAVQYEQPGITTDPAGAATAAAGYNLFSNANCSTSGTTNCTLYPCYNFTVGGSCNTSNSDGTLPDAVQVALTQPLNTAFANFVTAIWGPSVTTVNVTTTAIAAFPMLRGGQTCLLAVGSQPLSVGGSATLNLPNCTLASLSTLGNSIQLPGSGNPGINAGPIATAGNVQLTDGSSPPHTFTYFPLQDPYNGVTKNPLIGSLPSANQCTTNGDVSINGPHPALSPGCYTNITLNGAAQDMRGAGQTGNAENPSVNVI
jgi:Flp pilus assembly protein TadG